jgi:hypothetical protein
MASYEGRYVLSQVSCPAYCCRCGLPRRCWWTVVWVPGSDGQQLAGWMCAACRACFGLRSA